ncbi:unnamed protein product, partial [Iphiclides podalirius]
MIPSKYVPGQSSAARKSRLEGKPSMLPKPRRPGSTDRFSTEARRPSTAGHRSSSAEPPRATLGGGRLSREASATKLSMNPRSRSQQGDARYGQPATTPLRSSHYFRTTTTPQRTPSEDRANPSWQTSLDRALAFVTVKDQRVLSSAAWQRAEWQRVGEALAARAASAAEGGGGMALIRPLTIARFVEITGALLQAITNDAAKLNTDNYLTKLPHLSKRLLYPGAVSKNWLRTVNTLHAFPHALALIAYLLDLANHIQTPVVDEWLYMKKDDLTCLRHDYLYKCWIRFQDPDHQFEDINEEYLQNLKMLLGNNEEKIAELQQIIKKYEACLEDEAELAARAEAQRRAERRDALAAALRAQVAERLADRSAAAEQRAAALALADALRLLDMEMERANAENQRLLEEVAQQPLSISERTRLLDEVDYALRVHDSKRALAEQIAKMVLSKETELALWQKKTLDSCVEYKQGLIHLSAKFPELSANAIDENELMSAACSEKVCASIAALREGAAALARQKALRTAERATRRRQRAQLMEETQAKIAELKSLVELEQQARESELSKENAEAAAWSAEKLEIGRQVEALRTAQEHHAKVDTELDFWERQNLAWQEKLSAMREYIELQREEAVRVLQAAKEKRYKILMDSIQIWNEKLAQ